MRSFRCRQGQLHRLPGRRCPALCRVPCPVAKPNNTKNNARQGESGLPGIVLGKHKAAGVPLRLFCFFCFHLPGARPRRGAIKSCLAGGILRLLFNQSGRSLLKLVALVLQMQHF